LAPKNKSIPSFPDPNLYRRLLTVQGAARYLGLSYWTVRRMLITGVLPRVVIPGCRRLLVDRRDLDRALEAWKESADGGAISVTTR
jgi:excisionase family DNA binding protein